MEQPNTGKVAIYLRVSTNEQDVQNQLMCITDYLTRYNLQAGRRIDDKEHASAPWQTRGIGTLIATGEPGTTIIVSEVSRLARNTLDCLEIFKAAAEARICIVAVKNGLVMDNSMSAKIYATMLGMAAEIERAMIIARTTEALARRRAAGLPLGRPHGAKSPNKLNKHREKIEQLLEKEISKSAICKLLEVSRGTLNRALADWSEQP